MWLKLRLRVRGRRVYEGNLAVNEGRNKARKGERKAGKHWKGER